MTQPPPQPIPVQTLEYGHVLGPQRPGVLTAVAIMSLILALGSGLVSLQTGASAMIFAFMPTAPVPAVSAATVGPARPSLKALPASAAIQLADQIARKHSLSQPRKANLAILLEEDGQEIFRMAGAVNADSEITEAGKADKNDYLLTGLGRIELADDGASFQATGDSFITRIGAVDAAQTQMIVSASAARYPLWLDQNGQGALTAYLQSSKQKLIDLSTDAPSPATQLIQMSRDAAGNTTIFSDRGYVVFSPGWMTLQSTLGPAPVSVQNAVAVMPFPIFPRIGSAQTISMVISAVVSLLLAIYLLIASILVFRDSPSGRKHHLRWASIKIPVVIVGAAIYGWWMGTMMSGMIAGMPGGGAGVPTTMFYWIYALMSGFFGLIYPILVLILMNLRSVKQYYLSMRS